jgi:hypothetical protein
VSQAFLAFLALPSFLPSFLPVLRFPYFPFLAVLKVILTFLPSSFIPSFPSFPQAQIRDPPSKALRKGNFCVHFVAKKKKRWM